MSEETDRKKVDMNQDPLARAATMARGLAIDAVHACSSGHLGLPLGAAEMGAVLFGQALRYVLQENFSQTQENLPPGQKFVEMLSHDHCESYEPKIIVKAFRSSERKRFEYFCC